MGFTKYVEEDLKSMGWFGRTMAIVTFPSYLIALGIFYLFYEDEYLE